MPSTTISNKAAWHDAGKALAAAFEGKRNLYFTLQDDPDGTFGDPTGAVTADAVPEPPAEGTFYADVLTILVLSSSYQWDQGHLERIKADYPKFAGYRVVIYLDTAFMRETIPSVVEACVEEIDQFCRDNADYGFRFGGQVSYLEPDSGLFAAEVRRAWPDLG